MSNKYKKGFGLLEVLVSAVIIVTILSAMVFIGRSTLNNSQYAQERAQAIYLAQEGIEIVRQIRDTNWIDENNATAWNSWKYVSDTFSAVETGRCYKIGQPISTLSSAYYGRQNLQYANLTDENSCKDALKSSAQTDGWDKRTLNNLDFYRNIYVEDVEGLLQPTANFDQSAYKVTVFIQWKNRGSYRNDPIEVSEIITNWRPNY